MSSCVRSSSFCTRIVWSIVVASALQAEQHLAAGLRDPQPRAQVDVVRGHVLAANGLHLDGPEFAERPQRLVEVLGRNPKREAPGAVPAP